MTVKEYSIKKLGRNFKVSAHFTLGEIASKDGADKVLCSEELLAKLENLRAILGGDDAEVKILPNSFYRTVAHNKSVGGATNSNHTKGLAVDLKIKKGDKYIPAKLICCLCQDLDFNGVAYINENSVHLDMSNRIYRGDERYGYGNNVGGDFYSYFGIKKSQVEALKVKIEEPTKEPVKEPVKVEEPVKEPVAKEEEEMTQDQFNAMMNNWLSAKAAAEPSEWSAEARKWAEDNGIIIGTGAGYSYESYCTREQMVMFLYRLAEMLSK